MAAVAASAHLVEATRLNPPRPPAAAGTTHTHDEDLWPAFGISMLMTTTNGDDDKGGAPKKVELINDFVIKLGGGSHLPLNFF